jgi:CxxC motif-containing protein (DUF1111 family)
MRRCPQTPRAHWLAALLLSCAGAPKTAVEDSAGGPTADGQADGGADSGAPAGPAAVVPLYDEDTELEGALVFERDGAIVTRFADRGRDRHAREDEFQSYDHYLPHYWSHRTARYLFTDAVAAGGGLEVSMVSEWRLSVPEFRAWYAGRGSVASYHGNYAGLFVEEGPGVFNDDHELISTDGPQYRYSATIPSAMSLDGASLPLAVGQFMEIEGSQFLAGVPEGRANYYGTTLLYAVGVGGLVPWQTEGRFEDAASARENSVPIDAAGWLGGGTTVSYNYSDEPDNAFLQMAGQLGPSNGQPFVRGRRVHHTDMLSGEHDESPENPVFDALVGIGGPNYMARSCDGCHVRNGRAAVAAVGEPLEAWVLKLGDGSGGPDPARGRVLQPRGVDGPGEGAVWIAEWIEADGLRRPAYGFEGAAPAQFSARIAPQLVGMGLLEAIPEAAVLALEDPEDADGDGVSGRAQRVADPVTGELRLGRFGWRAGAVHLHHQIAAALRDDMGVLTTIFTEPDCGPAQTDCGPGGAAELADPELDDLRRYVALLGVRARRDLDDPAALNGEARFAELGCAACHTPTFETSAFHPQAELRSQTIHPYTDLLLHDLGPELADTLGEGEASPAEWRTPPLWGLGLGPCVTGGVVGPFQSQVCEPSESYLHDGRARTLTEAIRWHGGEGAGSRDAFLALDEAGQAELLAFLRSL